MTCPPACVVALGADDAGELLTLQRAAYVTEAQRYRDPYLPPLLQTLDHLRSELADPAVVALGIALDRRLVAAVRVRIEGSTGHLGRLVVAPDQQGRGWGTRLLLEVEDQVRDKVSELRLFTGHASTATLRLYERHGYRECDREPVHAGWTLVHLVKTLGPRDG